MKKRAILWGIVAAAGVTAALTVPGMVQSSIPSIYYVTPSVKTYENVVHCTGTIQSEQVHQVYASTGFVAGSIQVSPGDTVYQGQVLMGVDREATGALNQNAVTSVLQDAASGLGGGAYDLLSLLTSYGFTELTGGIDVGDLASGIQADAEAAVVQTIPVMTAAEAGEVTAPIYGMVTGVGAVEGAYVAPGKSLFTIQDVRNYKVVASISEGEISKVQAGDPAVIRGTGFSGTSFDGVVTAVSPVARKTLSGTSTDTVVDVEISLLNPNNKLKPGFSAKVEITGDYIQEMVTVPYEAIRQDENNDEYVYVYEDGKLKKSPIVTGRELTNEVEILEGLSFDSVVIFNPDDVQGEGTMVNIKGRAGDA